MGWLSNFFGNKPVTHINEQKPVDKAKAFAQLQENLNQYPDLFASMLDRFFSNGEWWVPTSTFPALGGTSNKLFGADRYAFYSEQDLRFQRDAARLLFAKEPVAKAIEGNLNAYVVGKGNTYKIVVKKPFKEQITEEMLQTYQEYLDVWLDVEQWAEREKECYTCKVVDGEFFLWVRVNGGRYSIRRIEPEHIQNPMGKTYKDGWYLGVKYDLKDAETPLAYGYKSDYMPFQEIPAEQIIHVKANVTKNVSRGISDFYAVMDDMNSIAGLADNMRDGATARAEIAYMWSIKNATPQAIGSFAGTQKDRQTTNPVTGKTERSKGMKSGKAVAHGDNVEFTTMPTGDSTGYVTIYQSAIRAIGARWSMPEYMISADASNNNYASIQVAGSPFDRYVQREQNTLKMHYKRLMLRVLEQAAVAMIIPTSVLPMLDIEIGCDSPVIVNKLEEAQVNEIEVRNGVLSPQQWCMANGRDYEETQQQIEEWRDRNMEAMLQQQGIPYEVDGGGDDGGDGGELGAFQESVGWDETKHKRASDGRFGNVAGVHGRRTDGKAHVVPGEALSTHIKATKGKELWRGVPKKEFAKQFESGELKVGKGAYGPGVYVGYGFNGRDTANTIAGEEGHTARMALTHDAKTITWNDAETEWEKSGKEEFSIEKYDGSEKAIAAWAASKGYDAIDVEHNEFMNILNPQALVVEHPDIKESVNWDEHKHPRAADGKFGSSGSSAKPKVKVSHAGGKVSRAVNELLSALNAPNEKAILPRLKALNLADTCSRCGGSGEFSFNQRDGSTCYGCGGSGIKMPKVDAELIASARDKVKNGGLDPYLERLAALKRSKEISKNISSDYQSLKNEEEDRKEKAGVGMGWDVGSEKGSLVLAAAYPYYDSANGIGSKLSISKGEDTVRLTNLLDELQKGMMSSGKYVPSDADTVVYSGDHEFTDDVTNTRDERRKAVNDAAVADVRKIKDKYGEKYPKGGY